MSELVTERKSGSYDARSIILRRSEILKDVKGARQKFKNKMHYPIPEHIQKRLGNLLPVNLNMIVGYQFINAGYVTRKELLEPCADAPAKSKIAIEKCKTNFQKSFSKDLDPEKMFQAIRNTVNQAFHGSSPLLGTVVSADAI